jgi:hypothetical protein
MSKLSKGSKPKTRANVLESNDSLDVPAPPTYGAATKQQGEEMIM